MMVSAGGYKRGFSSILLRELKTKNATVETQRPLEIGNFEMHMADPHPRIDG